MLQKLSSASLPINDDIPVLDVDGEPAYGLIFGAFMLCGVLGNYTQPFVLNCIAQLSNSYQVVNEKNSSDSPKITITTTATIKTTTTTKQKNVDKVKVDVNKSERDMKPIYILTAICYFFGSILFLIPCIADDKNEYSFLVVLGGFLLYEYLVGTFMSLQSIIRSVHIPNDSKCSIMTMLRVLTNTAVSIGVVLTIHIPMAHCFGILSLMMITACILQLSFLPGAPGRRQEPCAQYYKKVKGD